MNGLEISLMLAGVMAVGNVAVRGLAAAADFAWRTARSSSTRNPKG